MKVLCIDASTDADSEMPVDLVEGQIYTVVDDQVYQGLLWYCLQENLDAWYSSDAFVPLSDIDEMELLKQREKELCY